MARKLADHNAIKTVAAVGIFVIMILIGAFLGVYQFVHPLYRSEALIKLAAPAVEGAELDAWMKSQMDFMRSPAMTGAAWKILRSGDEHYGMHDVREEWLSSLTKHLTVDMEAASRTMFVRYSGPDATGVSQVCNALASAYTTPTLREQSDQATLAMGLGSQTIAKATVPLSPSEDSRMMLALSVVAGVLFVSLLLVMLFRHFVARQLKEIDQMADAQDLDEMHSDLNPGTNATPAV